jgi:hypothetical protein
MSGKSLAGYGAGGRGVMTLATCGASPKNIKYLCDKNPSIHGLYAPKSHVKIASPEQIFNDEIDEVVVFSYGYMDEIKQDLAPYTSSGGKLKSLLELI